MTAETSNARGEVVAWFPTNAQGEIIRNYGDGSPVYAYRTKEEAEQAKRCHLGATGPVIPLYAAPPPSAPVAADWITGDGLQGIKAEAHFLTQHKEEAVQRAGKRLLDRADKIIAALYQPPSAPVGVEGLVRDLVCEIERNTCTHEETHRGGVLWEICNLCGAKWADDRGGKPEFQWPDCVEQAHKWLAQQPAAVDEAMVDRAGQALYGTDWGSFEGWEADQLRRKVRAVLTAALATQHQEPKP